MNNEPYFSIVHSTPEWLTSSVFNIPFNTNAVASGTYNITNMWLDPIEAQVTNDFNHIKDAKIQSTLERQYALAQRSHNKKQMKLLEKQINANRH